MTVFGDSETITVADLQVGDFIEVIPTQGGVRGSKVESGVASLDIGSGWRRSRGRGRAGLDIKSVRIATLRGHLLDVPADFSVSVRRPQ